MADSETTGAGLPADLGEILAAELEVCSRLVTMAEEVRCGLVGHSPGDLLQALQAREDVLEELAALERRTAELRSGNADLPTHLRSQRMELLRMADRLSREETALRQLAGDALSGMRKQLRGLRVGAQLIRSYRGPASTQPRFSDRRG